VADERSTSEISLVEGARSKQMSRRKWGPYVDATLGFRNHWYPIRYSDEVDEGDIVPVTLLGEPIVLTRVDGQVRGIQDRCAHRGVRFSAQPLCFQKGTISCWYHGWTYDVADGRLCDVLTSPRSPVIGRVAIPAYPVQEAQGLVFVYVGDGEPQALSCDVPPGFLDEDTSCLGIRRTVRANWRLGVENGFDTTHIFMHRESPLIKGNNIALPLGFVPADRSAMHVDAGGWPKGVVDHLAQNYIPIFEASVRGETAWKVELTGDEKMVAAEVSVWLPGVLKVDPFPDPSLIQYEFYVPTLTTEHEYFQVLQRRVETEDEADSFRKEFDETWRDLALHGFNDDDVWAREELEPFYRDGDGWCNERLFPPDMCIVEWRRLAATHARGIQPAPGNRRERDSD
jgi:carbazole 1,9a-dioxygenase